LNFLQKTTMEQILVMFILFISFISASPLSSPLFLWSNTKIFKSVNQEIFQSTTTQDLSSFIVASQSPLSVYYSETPSKPEIVVLFTQELSRNEFDVLAKVYDSEITGGSFSNLKTILENAASSVIIPYASTDSSSLALHLKDLVKRQPILVSQTETSTPFALKSLKFQQMSLSTLGDRLRSDWDILNNQVVDLIIVTLEGKESDTQLAKVIDSIKNTKYVAAFVPSSNVDYTTVFPDTHPIMFEFETLHLQDQQHTRAVVGNKSNSNGTVVIPQSSYWPAGIVQGLIVSIPLLIILSVGVHCAFTLQSALKFDAEKRLAGK